MLKKPVRRLMVYGECRSNEQPRNVLTIIISNGWNRKDKHTIRMANNRKRMDVPIFYSLLLPVLVQQE